QRNHAKLPVGSAFFSALLGLLSAALEVLDGIDTAAASGRAPEHDQDAALNVDILALRGRIAKQRFVEARATDDSRIAHLSDAIDRYEEAYEAAGANLSLRYYPGINIVGLLARADQSGVKTNARASFTTMIEKVDEALDAVKGSEAGFHWWQATKAETAIPRGRYDEFATLVHALVNGQKTPEERKREAAALDRIRQGAYFQTLPAIDTCSADAFVLNSFHRQLMEVWNVDGISDPKLANPVMVLRQALLKRHGGSLEFDTTILRTIDRRVQQGVFGDEGPAPLKWVLKGIERAKSVGAVLAQDPYLGWRRIGTGFLMRMENGNEHHFLTNQHVIGAGIGALRIRFETVDECKKSRISSLVWLSEAHDAALLKLEGVPDGVPGLEFHTDLPELEIGADPPRVYAIGHTNGEQLHMSLQDNELLDHEGDSGLPPTAPVRLHYRTPTRPGNSGSPIFAQHGWALIGLHRAALKQDGGLGLTLSGNRHYNEANEGVSISSINSAMLSSAGFSMKRATPD
ncbi:MAG: hypothetical protein DCF30_07330, partial [Hyphomicrobiales bacterium]